MCVCVCVCVCLSIQKVELATGMLWRDWVDATLSTMYKARLVSRCRSEKYSEFYDTDPFGTVR